MAIIPGAQNSLSPLGKRQKNKQTFLVYLLILILVATVAIYFLFTNVSGIANAPVIAPPSEAELASYNLADSLKTVDLDKLVLLKNERFKSLVLHGDLPVVVGEKGRILPGDNPFKPISN